MHRTSTIPLPAHWTTPAQLQAALRKLFEQGRVLAPLAGAPALFPRRFALKGPSQEELSSQFEASRTWIAQLRALPGFRLELREVRHRILGSNQWPKAIWVDTLDDALQILDAQPQARRFAELVDQTRAALPVLLSWLARHPLRALDCADDWPLLLEVVHWLQRNPRPDIHLRQIDLPGIHSKFIEGRRGVMAELLDRALPSEAILIDASPGLQFNRRYGLRDKPARIRLRPLDPALNLLPGNHAQDLTLDQHSFAQLQIRPRCVLVTENEVNYLSLPSLPGCMALFGAGYGFSTWTDAHWLHDCQMHYWGDIDTHGFAILDQLRASFPTARSVLMDCATLLAHRAQWVSEHNAHQRELNRLDSDELALYNDLRDQRLGTNVRLEQERIGFGWVAERLARLASHHTHAP